MTNIGFLTTINGSIFKSNEYKYYVLIPFISYNEEESYLNNFKNSILILLTDELLANNDLEEFINNLDDRYEYINTKEIDLNSSELSFEYICSKNYKYYTNLNKLANIELDEDDLKNFNVTFMNIIKESYRYDNLDVTDYLYKYVVDFYSNGQFDSATVLMNTIFNTQLTTTSETQCGCGNTTGNCVSSKNSNLINTGTDLININNASCLDKYKAAIYQWLIQMLSDYNFYCRWFITDEDIIEENILNKLIILIKGLLNSNIDLSNLDSSKNTCRHSKSDTSNKCDNVDDLVNDNTSSLCTNYSILNNYIKVLEWVKEGNIEDNKNKIYIYGKKFAEIFPLLNF